MKQAESSIKSVRDWGCYLVTLAYIAGVRDIKVVDNLFEFLVKARAVLDNDIEIAPGNDWYRCFVLNAEYCVEAFGREVGKDLAAKELSRGPIQPRNAPGMHIIKEAVGPAGSHFGQIAPEVFNPDSRLPFVNARARSWRVWRVS